MTRLPVTRVDSTVLPVSFFDSIGLQVLSTGIQSRVLDMCVDLKTKGFTTQKSFGGSGWKTLQVQRGNDGK